MTSKHSNRSAVIGIDASWPQRGACRRGNAELWFSPNADEVAEAKEICEYSCPVLAECKQWALHNREPYGVWGGLSESERTAPPSKRIVATHCLNGHRRTSDSVTSAGACKICDLVIGERKRAATGSAPRVQCPRCDRSIGLVNGGGMARHMSYVTHTWCEEREEVTA